MTALSSWEGSSGKGSSGGEGGWAGAGRGVAWSKWAKASAGFMRSCPCQFGLQIRMLGQKNLGGSADVQLYHCIVLKCAEMKCANLQTKGSNLGRLEP
eukprot:588816-Pelagomonas_calceolata.AAC.2